MRDDLAERLSRELGVERKVVDTVLQHQFESLRQAFRRQEPSLEVSGFGKFLVNRKTAARVVKRSEATLEKQRLEYVTATPKRRETLERKMARWEEMVGIMRAVADGKE